MNNKMILNIFVVIVLLTVSGCSNSKKISIGLTNSPVPSSATALPLISGAPYSGSSNIPTTKSVAVQSTPLPKSSVIPSNALPNVSVNNTKKAISQPISATSPATEPIAQTVPPEPAVKIFTLSELKNYNGQNGNPAYVAIDGTVYDVTNARGWNNGKHKGLSAGNDLTSQLNNSPHGASVLQNLTVVGKLAG